MKLKELVKKIKNKGECRIVCKCGRVVDMELCGDYEVGSVEINHDLIIIKSIKDYLKYTPTEL